MSLQPAPPNDFDEFLRRVDLWNYFGALPLTGAFGAVAGVSRG